MSVKPSASLVAALTPFVSSLVFLVGGELVTHGVITSGMEGPIAKQIVPLAAAGFAYLLTLIGNEAWFRKLESDLSSAAKVNAELLTRLDQLQGRQNQTIELVTNLQNHIYLQRAHDTDGPVPFPQS